MLFIMNQHQIFNLNKKLRRDVFQIDIDIKQNFQQKREPLI